VWRKLMADDAGEPAPVARVVPDTAPAVIFVHGLGGTPKSTWAKMLDCFKSDEEFQDWALDCFHFPTCQFQLPFFPPPPGLRGIAEGLKTFIEERHGARSLIALVAHSLGGLVARQFIVSELRAGKHHHIDKLALIAVPSSGSALASVGSLVSFRHRQLLRLSRDDEGLRGVNIDWEQLNVEGSVEVRYILGGRDLAVPHDSAVPFFGRDNRSMLINEDHRSIVQPAGKDDIRYRTIRRFVLNPKPSTKLAVSEPIAAPVEVLAPTEGRTPSRRGRPADPLFEAYTPRDEPFYVTRNFDIILMQTLGSGHVWLFGESGVGKSAALRRAVQQSGWHLNHLSLAGYEVANPLQLFRALCVELASMAAVGDLLPQDCALSELFLFLKRILRAFPADLIIANVVEEMPLECDGLAEFAELLAKFLTSLVGEPDLYRRVQFALSSLQDVGTACKPISAKTREQIQLIPAERWPVHDGRRLVELLASTLKLELTSESQEKIAISAAGSPRFIKQVFRHWRNGTFGRPSVDQLIERVQGEQVR
jgi:pimeloyl-ACP methyl ester carboxylesterase